jgi:hypothetical protein
MSADRRDLWRHVEGGKKSGTKINNIHLSQAAPKDREIDD